jgi:hypothetical protein
VSTKGYAANPIYGTAMKNMLAAVDFQKLKSMLGH